jgi:excinuclease UvrABC helicase subunit UvrB
MRNIIEYPITFEEVLTALDAVQQQTSQPIGGIDGVALFFLNTYVIGHEDEMRQYLAEINAELKERAHVRT